MELNLERLFHVFITGKFRFIDLLRNYFKESFFSSSESEPKGSDCYEAFKTMQDCMAEYPTVYNKSGDDDDGLDLEAVQEMSSSNTGNSESVELVEDKSPKESKK